MEKESAKWKCTWSLKKYLEDISPYKGQEQKFHELFKPYEILKGEGNCLLNTGINHIWRLVTNLGGSYPAHYDATYTTIGVGDSATAANASQTDLQASTNKKYNGMDSGWPISAGQIFEAQASFGPTEANYTWNEWVVKNSYPGYTDCLNRKVASLGTKSGGTWTLTVDITLA